MATYQYQALDEEGKKRKGFIEAETQAKAFLLLQDQDLVPMRLHPVSRAGSRMGARLDLVGKMKELAPSSRVRLGESFYYLGLLLQTGSSLSEALELLGRMGGGGRGGQIWLNVRDEVETGESFSHALRKYPRIFPAVYVGMVQVAENVGRLGPVLEKIARYEEERSEASGRLLTAMVYPAVILLVGIGAVYFLLSRVLPNIAKIFQGADESIPLTTEFLLALGTFLQDLGVAALLLPVVGVFGCVYAVKKVESLRLRWDKLVWRIPLFQKYILARFSGMLGFQLEAGIPLVQAMESSSNAVDSLFFKRIIEEARKEVSAGQPLDKVLARRDVFPELYLTTLSAGQKSGKLGAFLLRLTRILEKDVDNVLKRVVALVEPLLILFIGLMVGFIVMAIMGPIFDLTTLVE